MSEFCIYHAIFPKYPGVRAPRCLKQLVIFSIQEFLVLYGYPSDGLVDWQTWKKSLLYEHDTPDRLEVVKVFGVPSMDFRGTRDQSIYTLESDHMTSAEYAVSLIEQTKREMKNTNKRSVKLILERFPVNTFFSTWEDKEGYLFFDAEKFKLNTNSDPPF